MFPGPDDKPSGAAAVSVFLRPFREVFRLAAADFVAKVLNFVAFVYLARALGVDSYGILEFALAILAYLLLIGDGGLDLWGTRAVARGRDPGEVVARVVPLRFVLSICVLLIVASTLPFIPFPDGVSRILLIFGLTLPVQALDLRWVYMGREEMGAVGTGLVAGQSVFLVAVLIVVSEPSHIVWVPVFRLAADVATAVYFARRYAREHGDVPLGFRTSRGFLEVLSPAVTMGTSRMLALLNFNFDTVLLGFMVGTAAVGLYGAAYKPITAVLALPVTYFLGLFPTLSRAFDEGREAFRELLERSLTLTAAVAIPIGFMGTFFARPVILLLYGPEYAESVPVVQILSWSAVLVILRGNFRQSLNAAGREGADLRCAGFATAANVALNLLLIPRYGIVGAAGATVLSEIVWITVISTYFRWRVMAVGIVRPLGPPVVAAGAMAAFLALTDYPWIAHAAVAGVVYVLVLAGALALSGGPARPGPEGRS